MRVWASRDTTFYRTFFRAVSEQFQSSFRAVSEQFFFQISFYGNFLLISARLSLKRHYPFPYYFQSSFRAVSEQSWPFNGNCNIKNTKCWQKTDFFFLVITFRLNQFLGIYPLFDHVEFAQHQLDVHKDDDSSGHEQLDVSQNRCSTNITKTKQKNQILAEYNIYIIKLIVFER